MPRLLMSCRRESVLPDGSELVQDSPQGLLPHLAQGDLRDLGSGSLDLAFELRLPFFRLGKLLLEVGQRPVGGLELALLVGELGEDVVELPLEGFLLPEQGFPSVRSGIRAGEAPPDAFQFPFYPGPSRLQVGHHRPESLDADRCQSDLPVEPFESGSPADDLALCADTINYEVVCTVSKRVPRFFVHNDKITEVMYKI